MKVKVKHKNFYTGEADIEEVEWSLLYPEEKWAWIAKTTLKFVVGCILTWIFASAVILALG